MKYQTEFVKTKARKNHLCEKGHSINPGDFYYKEACKDRFLQCINPKKFCMRCYEKYGEKILDTKMK